MPAYEVRATSPRRNAENSWGRLLSAFEQFPGHEVLKFPDKADRALAFMFNMLALTKVLEWGGDRPDSTGATDE